MLRSEFSGFAESSEKSLFLKLPSVYMIRHLLLVILFMSWLFSAYYSEMKQQQNTSEDDAAIESIQYHRNRKSEPTLSSQSSLIITEIPAKHEPTSAMVSLPVPILSDVNQPKESTNQSTIVNLPSNTSQPNDSVGQTTTVNITDTSSALNVSTQSIRSEDDNLPKTHHKPYALIDYTPFNSYVVLSFLHVF